MPSRTGELFRTAWNRPTLGTPWLRRPRPREHPRGILPRRGQTDFRYRARGPRRSDCPRRVATGCRRSSDSPSHPLQWRSCPVTAFLCAGGFVGQLPRQHGAGSAGMVDEDLGYLPEPLGASPVALKLAGHPKPGDRLDSRRDEPADGRVVRFRGYAARRVGHGVHIVAIAHRVDSGHGKTHLRPEGGDDELPAAGLLHRLDDPAVLPGVDEGAVNRLLIRKDRLELLEDCA